MIRTSGTPGAIRLVPGGQLPRGSSPPAGAVTCHTCGLADPVGVDDPSPRLSWSARPVRSERLSVSTGGREVWARDLPAGTSWADVPEDVLEPLTSYTWSVAGHLGGTFVTGLRAAGAWDAPWIGDGGHDPDRRSREPGEDEGCGRAYGTDEDDGGSGRDGEGAVRLRGTFGWRPRPGRAWLATTALGVYRVLLNGERLGDEEFAPGWTDYGHRVRYRLADVTALLREGENLLEFWLAPGWYAGHVAAGGPRRYGDRPAASARLLLRDQDGLHPLAATGPGWTAADLGRPRADLVMGETVHLTPPPGAGETNRHEPPSGAGGTDRLGPLTGPDGIVRAGQGAPSCADRAVAVVEPPGLLVEADPAPPVREIATLAAVSVTEPVPGVQVLDFGRNVVGRLRLRVDAPEPVRLVVRHGEELAATGRLYDANLRTAEQRDEFVLPAGRHVAEPAFTFHGFRYAEVTGWPGGMSAGDAEAVLLSSALPVTGTLTASDPAVRQLVSNIVASAEGNLLSVPTDCPQRDERTGWTADISVFASTLSFLRHTQAFLSGWVTTLIDGQRADGAVPHVAPVLPEYGFDSPVWSDAIVEVPWLLWRRYGDDRTLRRAYGPMRRWADYCLAQCDDGLRPGRALGDWLAPGSVETPKSLIATAALARSLRLIADVAGVLGEPHAREYGEASTVVSGAFQRAFLSGHRLRTETQTGYALALAWDLVPPENRAGTAEALAELVGADGHRLMTGFVGTPLLLPALSETGHHDVACRIFNQEGHPSWRYQLRAGATSMWERWDAWHHRQGMHTPTMNSFNHYAYGCVGDWLFRHVAGIGDDPRGVNGGFTEPLLRPGPVPLLREAHARYDSPAGTVESGWHAGPDGLRFVFSVPPGVTARAVLPVNGTWDGMTVNGTFLMGLAGELPTRRLADGSCSMDLPSGRWSITAPAAAAEPLLQAWDDL
ncbi:family 78 glycoside hydrolase catalytic domain [Streptosporangium vulgare]|uniref:alpha-L-rhamnosidase n=1 Tax=Streptosporangium vulgare TaxID=46190 RepID=A0ABV5TS19_9ACTN